MKQKKFECMLGVHEYTIPDKGYFNIKICKHCKRKGYYKYPNGYEIWTKYDDKGNEIHWKDSYGGECWREYDDKGNEIHWKNSNGEEYWLDNNIWVNKKPKNWRYEKYETEKI